VKCDKGKYSPYIHKTEFRAEIIKKRQKQYKEKAKNAVYLIDLYGKIKSSKNSNEYSHSLVLDRMCRLVTKLQAILLS